jgi:hypothetical protein
MDSSQGARQGGKSTNQGYQMQRLAKQLESKVYISVIASVVMMKITDQLGTPRGRYDEHSSKFPSVRNQGFIVQEKVNTPEGHAC